MLIDADKYAPSAFGAHVEDQLLSLLKESASSTTSQVNHWQAVKERYESATTFKVAAHDLCAWYLLYSFDDLARITQSERAQ